jgi:Rad3-related DNA helicase
MAKRKLEENDGETEWGLQETFEYLFDKTPRYEQLQFAHQLTESLRNKSSLIAELPTGVGKTLLAFFGCHIAKGLGYPKSIIVAGFSQALQAQYIEQADKLQKRLGEIFAVFGASNYVCLSRLNNYMKTKEFEDLPTEAQKTLFEFGKWADGSPNMDNSKWYKSQQKEWKNDMNHILSETACDAVWNRVCADKTCECKKKAYDIARMTDVDILKVCTCPKGRSRIFMKRADILIINISYWCTMAAQSRLEMLLTDNEIRKPVFVDEGHLIHEGADNIFEMYEHPKFNVETANKVYNQLPPEIKTNFKFDTKCFEHPSLKTSEIALLTKKRLPIHSLLYEAIAQWDVQYDLDSHEVVRCYLKEKRNTIDGMMASFQTSSLGNGSFVAVSKEEIQNLLNLEDFESLGAQHIPRVCKYVEHLLLMKDVSSRNEWSHSAKQIFDALLYVVKNQNKEHPSCEQLEKELKRIGNLVVSIDYCKKATHPNVKDVWLAMSTQAAVANNEGIHFCLSRPEKANALKEQLCFEKYVPIVMSATLMDKKKTFEHYQSSIGYIFDDNFDLPTPFTLENWWFWLHPMYLSPIESNQERQLQSEIITSTILKKPLERRLTLVISRSTDYYLDIKSRLEQQLPHLDHVEIDKTGYHALCHSERQGVIYGNKTLITGIDMPGQVGLIVILKPLQVPLSPAEQFAIDFKGKNYKYWNWDYYYAAGATLFRQSCGRGIRSHIDKCVVLCFDKYDTATGLPKKKEEELIETYFQNGTHRSTVYKEASLPEKWPYEY